jgi:hypothetical protein
VSKEGFRRGPMGGGYMFEDIIPEFAGENEDIMKRIACTPAEILIRWDESDKWARN